MKLLDHDNTVAVLWGALYSFGTVLVAGTSSALGITPFLVVPAIVVVLPIALGLALLPLDRRGRGAGP